MKTRYSETVGLNIKKYREMNNMTQIEMAELLKIAQPTLACYESGEREANYKMLYKICDILEIDFNELFKFS